MADDKEKTLSQDLSKLLEGELTDANADKVVGGAGTISDFNVTKNTDKSTPTL
jgi:hypothetical protein